MSVPSFWLPVLLWGVAGFVVASLVSGLVYWVAHLKSSVLGVVEIAVSTITFTTLTAVVIASLSNVNPPPILLAFPVVLGASALQGAIERAIFGQRTKFVRHFSRAFFSSICSVGACYFLLLVGIVAVELLSWRHFLWSLNSDAALLGLGAGLVFAPISISFYRWMFQTLALRPGVDRVLREDEVVG